MLSIGLTHGLPDLKKQGSGCFLARGINEFFIRSGVRQFMMATYVKQRRKEAISNRTYAIVIMGKVVRDTKSLIFRLKLI
jgi:hypothetical protein